MIRPDYGVKFEEACFAFRDAAYGRKTLKTAGVPTPENKYTPYFNAGNVIFEPLNY